MDLDVVCTRLAAAAGAYGITGLICLDYVPDMVDPPVLYPADITIRFAGAEVTFGGDPDAEIAVRVLTSRADDQAGQKLLRQYMNSKGPVSVKLALESNRGAPGESALDGACDDYHVRGVRGHRLYTVGDKQYFGAEWVVHVFGDGDA